MEERPRTVALIGPGRAGTTVALGLLELGWTVTAVAGRAPDAASTTMASAVLATRPARAAARPRPARPRRRGGGGAGPPFFPPPPPPPLFHSRRRPSPPNR